MNNATGRLFLKASHKASAFSGILLEHEKQRSCAAAYQRRQRQGREAKRGGMDGRRVRERGVGGEELLLGFVCFRGGKCPVK